MPAKDLPHHLGFGVMDDQVSSNVTVPRHMVVAVRHAGPENLSLSSSVKLAATIALGQFRALIFRYRTLDLNQKRGLWILWRWLLEKHHRRTKALELFEDKDQVGVLA
jgi:hypothetical protein